MTCIFKGFLQGRWQSQLQIIRHSSRVRITKPRPPHFERAVVETLCLPYFNVKKKERHIPDYDVCFSQEVVTPRDVHPVDIVLGREVLQLFQNSKLIAIFHQDAMDPEEKFKARLMLKKSNLKYMQYSQHVMKQGLTGSIYEAVLVLFKCHTVFAISNEEGIHGLMNISKKLPKLVLMGAVFENRLLSVSELEYYGELENIESARMKLLSTLNSVPLNLMQKINHHPNNIVQLLNQHQEHNKDKIAKS